MKNVRQRAFVFDMDGVIIDSEPWHTAALDKIFDVLNVPQARGKEPALGTGIYEFFARLKDDYSLEQSLDFITRTYFSAVFDLIKQNNVREEKHLKDLLEFLKENGYSLAVASSSLRAYVDNVLEYLGLSDLFSVKVGGNEVESAKPAPDLYLKAAELLGVDPADCFAAEDSFSGSLAAKRAGIPCFGYRGTPTAKFTDFSNCFTVANDFNDILNYLKKENV